MKEKLHIDHSLYCNLVALEEYKRKNVERLQNFIIKKRQNTKKSDSKLDISLLNIKEMQSKLSDVEDQNEEFG